MMLRLQETEVCKSKQGFAGDKSVFYFGGRDESNKW